MLDTSVLIDFLRRKDKEKNLLVQIIHSGYSPVISLITQTELFAGESVWRSKKARKELENLLSGLEMILINKKVSQSAGKIRVKYQINLLDAIIAAEAIVSNLPLATLNVKDFKKIRKIKIFRVGSGCVKK